MTTSNTPEQRYRDRAHRAATEAAEASARFNLTANLRLLTALAVVASAAVGIWLRLPWLAIVSAAGAIAFGVLVWRHLRLRRERDRAALLAEINREGLRRLGRDWERLPLRHDVPADPGHPYARDLDIVGRASVMHLIDTTTSPMGTASLARWLLAPAPPTAVSERQDAAAELAPLLDLRQETERLGRGMGPQREDVAPFLEWCEEEPWLRRRPLLRWAAWISPTLFLLLFIGWAAHLVPYPVWILPLITNLVLWARLGGHAERALGRVRVQQGALTGYAGQLRLLVEAELHAPRLIRLKEMASAGGIPAHRLLRRLDSILSFNVPGSSPAVLVMQSLFLWNINVLGALEGWQAQVGPRARGWLDALGELEALCSLATLAHDQPEWARPDLDPAAEEITASRLGHPLLAPSTRVDNDVTLGPPGSFLLVTGSNMSGKSTLLRSIGVNVVLASAGATVCGRSFRLPPLELWTSMRIDDSLEQGTSFFLAEVRRLKQVVDAARSATSPGPMVCYLLDEILQGTNTAERQIAARSVIEHLARQHAIGAVSTHDLTLADAPELDALARRVHFRETVSVEEGRPAMTFDYRLRDGLATSTNALRLMEAMGLMEAT